MVLDPVPNPFNMAAHVLAHARTSPNKVALATLSQTGADNWTYGEIERAIRGTATGLINSGLTAGDRVLLRLGNTPEFPITFLACITAGLIPVPTSAQLSGPEITTLARTLAPACIIAADGIALPEDAVKTLAARDLAAFYDLPPAPFVMGDADRPAYIIFTSGTSGRARGVVHGHRAICARRMMVDGWYGLRATDRVLHAGAFNWTYTLGTGLMDPWANGATALIAAHGTPSAMLPRLMQDHGATIFAAAPGIYRQLLKSDLPKMPNLRHGLSAGEKLPERIRSAWESATQTPVFEAYGMSECSTFISGCPDAPADAGTLGRPQPGRTIALLSEDGMQANNGQIAVHQGDPGLMLGYLDASGSLDRPTTGGWFLTGDIGARTASGCIRYDGRVDDMMNAGGYRVSPIEVESALALHPGIDDAAAVELPVKSDATVIAAFYMGPSMIEDSELAAHCARHLARYKTPRLFIHRETLPRGANNKLLRRALRTEWEAAHGQA